MSGTTTAEPEMLTKTALKARGWTDAIIRDFAGSPDAERPNPQYRAAAPMLLWDAARIDAIESSPEFVARHTKAAERSTTRKAVAARKAHSLISQAEQVPIRTAFPATAAQVVARALQSKAERFAATGRDSDVHSAPDDVQLRWCYNYLRHECCTYELVIDSMRGQVGIDRAYQLVRERVERLCRERFAADVLLGAIRAQASA